MSRATCESNRLEGRLRELQKQSETIEKQISELKQNGNKKRKPPSKFGFISNESINEFNLERTHESPYSSKLGSNNTEDPQKDKIATKQTESPQTSPIKPKITKTFADEFWIEFNNARSGKRRMCKSSSSEPGFNDDGESLEKKIATKQTDESTQLQPVAQKIPRKNFEKIYLEVDSSWTRNRLRNKFKNDNCEECKRKELEKDPLLDDISQPADENDFPKSEDSDPVVVVRKKGNSVMTKLTYVVCILILCQWFFDICGIHNM